MPSPRTRSRSAPAWRGPFRHRNYRLFWFGQLVSLAGTWMQSIAQAWYITELTHEPAWLGIVAAVAAIRRADTPTRTLKAKRTTKNKRR